MNFGFVMRKEPHHGGDLVAIRGLQSGLRKLGHRVFEGHDVPAVRKSDYIFLSNSCLSLRDHLETLLKYNKRYGVITFHEDNQTYFAKMKGFNDYGIAAYNHGRGEWNHQGDRFALEYLRQSKYITEEFATRPLEVCPPTSHINRHVFENADHLFVHADSEKEFILKYIPNCNPITVKWSTGIMSSTQEYNDSFLKLTGFTKGEYILTVGRIEPRKNQFASLLALQDSDIPWVICAQSAITPDYIEKVLEVAYTRKGPTLVISPDIEAEPVNSFRVINTDGAMLKDEVIHSAYQNAGLHLHTPFWEMPGYTYLEAARYNLPQVASEWGSIKEYFSHGGGSEDLDGRVKFCDPRDITAIDELVHSQFGKTFEPMDHPIFHRTQEDVASEYLKQIQGAAYA